MSKKIELNRRRVLGGIATIGVASAAIGAGTFAAFSDTETSSNNSFTAGTLNLELNPSSGASTTISASTIVPGDEGYLAINLENTGNVNGNLTEINVGDVSGGTFSASLVTNSDGTDSEFESSPSADGGELDDNLQIEVLLEASGDFTGTLGSNQGTQYGGSGNEDTLVSQTTVANALGSNSISTALNPGNVEVLVINWTLPSGTTNEVQGDTVEFDVQALLDQA